MQPVEEADITAVVEKVGARFTIIGAAVWMAAPIYAGVVVALALAQPAGQAEAEAVNELPSDFMLLLGILAAVSLFTVPTTFLLRGLMLRATPPGGVPVMWRVGFGDSLSEGIQRQLSRAAHFFRVSLVASAMAEAPSIFALVLSLLLVVGHNAPRATLFSGPYVKAWAVIVFMWGLSLVLTALVIPTAGKLEAFLRQRVRDAQDDRAETE